MLTALRCVLLRLILAGDEMNPELANKCMQIYILQNSACFILCFILFVIFVFYSIYCIIKGFIYEIEWKVKKKQYWEHVKEVQDRFKDDDMR